MSTAESAESPLAPAAANTNDDPLDAEAAARRALGIAMNSVWGGTEVASMPSLSPQLATEAQALLRDRVPAGRECDLAIELLERCAHPVRPH
jgi:hypothetical protein